MQLFAVKNKDYIRWARKFATHNEHRKASLLYSIVYQRRYKDRRYLIEYAYQLSKLGKYKHVELICKEILEAETSNIHILTLIAESLFKRKKYTKALEYINRILEINPEHITALKLNVSALLKHKQQGTAKVVAKKILYLTSSQSRFASYFEVLEATNKHMIIERILRQSQSLTQTGTLSVSEYIYRLLAAKKPKLALIELNKYKQAGLLENSYHRLVIAIFISQREFIQAYEYYCKLEIDEQKKLSPNQLNRLILFNNKSNRWDLDKQTGSTFRSMIVHTLLHHATNTKKPIYKPIKNRVMLFVNSLASGGSERQLVNIAIYLQKEKKLDVHFMVLNSEEKGETDFYRPLLQKNGITIHNCYDLSATINEAHHIKNKFTMEFIENLAETCKVNLVPYLIRAILALRPQIIHSRQGSSLELALASIVTGAPKTLLHFGNVTDSWIARENESALEKLTFEREIYQAILKHNNIRLALNSQRAAADWADFLQIPIQQVKLIYNGLEKENLGIPETEKVEELRKELNIPKGAFIVGGIFRFQERKDPFCWIQVAAKFIQVAPNAHFLLVGSGILKSEMKNKIKVLGLSDKFHFSDHVLSGIANYYALMDVFLLTSVMEGLPNVLIECQSLGIPAVAFDVGGVEEVISDNITGWVIRDKNKNIDSFIEPLEKLYANKALRESIQKNAPIFIENKFGMDQMIKSVIQAYSL